MQYVLNNNLEKLLKRKTLLTRKLIVNHGVPLSGSYYKLWCGKDVIDLYRKTNEVLLKILEILL